jgi:hypothetical protein
MVDLRVVERAWGDPHCLGGHPHLLLIDHNFRVLSRVKGIFWPFWGKLWISPKTIRKIKKPPFLAVEE